MSIKTEILSRLPKGLAGLLRSTKDKITFQQLLKSNPLPDTLPTHEGPIRVVFMLHYPAVWCLVQKIYQDMVQDSRFDVLVLAIPRVPRNGDYDESIDVEDMTVESFCKQEGLRYVRAASSDSDEWFDLEAWQPDYVFYMRPYCNQYPERYRIYNVCRYTRTCSTPYGYYMSDKLVQISHRKNFEHVSSMWYYFACSQTELDAVRESMPYLLEIPNQKRELFGFVGFDLADELSVPSQSERKTISWYPRFESYEDNYPSSFIALKDGFLSFAVAHPEMDFIVRPHPLLFTSVVQMGKLTQEDVDAFVSACEAAPNISLEDGGSYEHSVKEADVILTDFSSLMLTFLAAHKRVIDLFDDDGALIPEIKLVKSTFYHADTWEQAEAQISQLLADDDPKAELRESVRDELYMDGKVHERIVAYLLNEWENEKQAAQ